MVKVRKDLSGLRFGKLVVIKQAEDYISPRGRHDANWLCRCDCGNETIVRGSDLKNKKTKSCAHCNTYDLSGKYGICMTLNGGQFLFDLEDYNLIKQYCWSVRNKNEYATSRDKNGKKIYLHRLLMNPPDGYAVDHINHIKYDNRKSNLRICTHRENCLNVPPKSNNTSGYKGISKSNNKYRARITINGKEISLGRFNTIDEAIKARKEAEEKYFGEYAYNAGKDDKAV